jgi:hypothetical protein
VAVPGGNVSLSLTIWVDGQATDPPVVASQIIKINDKKLCMQCVNVSRTEFTPPFPRAAFFTLHPPFV